MEMNYPELFKQGLCDAAEKWSDIIIDSKNDTPARDEGPAFFIPQGFPHIDWIPGVSHCIFGCPSLAEGYSLSLAYFVNEYCFHDCGPCGNSATRVLGERINSFIHDEELASIVDDTVDSYSIEDSDDWSQGVAVIDDIKGKSGHHAATVYLGGPTCGPEQISSYCIPLATLFSSLNDSMTVWPGMDGDEYRRKMILWMVMLHRSCGVEWETFLEDFPAMAPVVHWILTLSDLLDHPKNPLQHFAIMDSDEVCDISLATQKRFNRIWGYQYTLHSGSSFESKTCQPEILHSPGDGPVDGRRSGDANGDLEPYLAMEHYVPGRDC